MHGLLPPFEGREGGGQLVELRPLLVLHPIVQEVTDSVHLVVAEVAAGAEVEGQGGELHVDAAAAAGCKTQTLPDKSSVDMKKKKKKKEEIGGFS